MRAWLVVVLAAGCGFRVNGGADSPGDAGDDAPGPVDAPDSAVDAPVDAPAVTCLPQWQSGTVSVTSVTALTTVNSTSYERDPTISADELTLWFSSGRPGSQGGDVWVATRADRNLPFGVPVLAAELNSAGAETRVSFTTNRLIAAIGSNRAGGEGGVDVWITTRATAADAWATPDRTGLDMVNDTNDQHDPFLSGDGLRLYYAPTNGGQHIVVSSRATVSGNFGAPVTLINSGVGDADPTLSPDERVMVYASNAPANVGGELWYVTRASSSGTFGTPAQLTGVSTTSSEGDPSLSADGCHLYFSSTRPGGLGDYDLYVAEIAP